MRLTLCRVETPLGGLLLASDAGGRLHACEFADCEDRLHLLLTRRLGQWVLVPGEASDAARALGAYFAGDLTAVDALPLVLSGTDFQNRAWTALRAIPPGQVRSYGEQAARLGHPRGARAVGLANSLNPFEIILPCHRLVGRSGALTGYAGGLARKRWLLDHEAAHSGGR
ncbi:methylated-DNA--[protein]-cysteine S-methyltransferase [Pseudogemmobacter humi]|uniref:methylated-DNA--[protein]-cysteine S-methyltransferase n=1 Tax=Pseudogemmobacter humi TaxID=2483812 RepID=A0A3P5WAD7_9RHOB|nr:methylated-DNA--[protein]-cysteine S-methyltransferase [Pseudogemmobacter humi]VDC20423.1 Methylated-DNA--protein-cysteine methyltransferase [Pseudogemmobacter humi]